MEHFAISQEPKIGAIFIVIIRAAWQCTAITSVITF
jgi:hypothetical protein